MISKYVQSSRTTAEKSGVKEIALFFTASDGEIPDVLKELRENVTCTPLPKKKRFLNL